MCRHRKTLAGLVTKRSLLAELVRFAHMLASLGTAAAAPTAAAAAAAAAAVSLLPGGLGHSDR